ncbi:MAG: transketolase, partial [Spirochaetales bacterium]|nr:transketolase [Spirochaetales bacterium]
MDVSALKALAQSVRALSMDAIQAANSGHPGLPLGCADFGALLWGDVLKHDPSDPSWPNRDRFILSAGHGSMLLYSLLHLTGYGLTLEDLKKFRQIGSKTPGHPEFGLTIGVETTTGPLGAGFGNAVGFAIAEAKLAAEFNTPEHAIVDHYTYVLAGDGCLMEGVASEAASLAGHLGLGKLIAFYDSNDITLAARADKTFTEDVAGRFKAYGWQVLQGDAYDLPGMKKLIEQAQAETHKPSLVILKSIIGYGSPHKQGSFEAHGSPLGAEEVQLTRKALGIPDQDFYVAPEAVSYVKKRQTEWKVARADWQKEFDAWAQASPALKAKWDQFFSTKVQVEWPAYKVGDSVSTRVAGGKALNAAAKSLPNILGGDADLATSTMTVLQGGGDFLKDHPEGRNLSFGVREHGMGAIVNGIVLHGGLRSFSATFLVFSDYMRPPIRLAALMKIPSVFVFTHDSVFVGEDGPTHQPVEHYAALRAIPNLLVLRPGDAEETNAAWNLALNHRSGPSALLLSRQNLKVYTKPAGWEKDFDLGGYIVHEPSSAPETVVLATGSEVNLALEAAALSKKSVRVVSVSSLESLKAHPEHLARLIPSGVRVVASESGIVQGWEGLITKGSFLGLSSFGESGPGPAVAQH